MKIIEVGNFLDEHEKIRYREFLYIRVRIRKRKKNMLKLYACMCKNIYIKRDEILSTKKQKQVIITID